MGLSSLFSPRAFSGLPYRLLAPPPRQTGLVPLVLFLHGAGERGSDNAAQLKNGAAELLGSPEARRQFPCFYALPQCPEGARWVEVDWSAPSHKMPPAPSRPLSLVIELLRALPAELPIDSSRIYLIGLSMGGYGAWDLLCRHAEIFAGAVVICGGGDESQAARLRSVPIWAFHGAKDDVVPVERSRHMIEALRRISGGPEPRYTEYPGAFHKSWEQAFAEPELLPWLFSQRKAR